MDSLPTVIDYLTKIGRERDFSWTAEEENERYGKVATITTSKELTDNEKARIERYGHYWGGPSKFIFKAIIGS